MSRENILDQIGTFTWGFSNEFFIETAIGNFVWSDPDYPGGENTLKRFNGTYPRWLKGQHIPFGRDKGKHVIRSYCGDDVIIEKES